MKNLTVEQAFRYVLRAIVVSLFGLAIFKGTKLMLSGGPTNQVTRCGTVVKHFESDDVRGKHGNYTVHNYYMDVNYDDGAIETVDVTTDTWYKNQVGSRVCFKTAGKESGWAIAGWFVSLGIAGIFWFALACILLYYASHVIYYAFTGNWEG